MDKIVSCTFIIFIGFSYINTQTIDNEMAKNHIFWYLKLPANATAEDICNELQKTMTSELELLKRKGESGVLPPEDPNHLWMNECKKKDYTMDSLMTLITVALNHRFGPKKP